MDVSIIGASGDVGRQVAVQLLAERLLHPTDRLQLVGRSQGPSAGTLHGLAADLSDAFAESAPELDVALSPEEIVGDVVVMTAGATLSTDPAVAPLRQSLGAHNLPIFRTYAQALERFGSGHEVVVIVSNPVELGVEVFSQALGRHRVIGIGAYQDSLRFRRELANMVGLRRQQVAADVVGEHGEAMLPLWSSVRFHGMDLVETGALVQRLRRGRKVADFPAEVTAAKAHVVELLAAGRMREAFTAVDHLPPDLRVVVKPYVTHLSGAKTAAATANVTVDLVRTLMDGREIVVAGQVRLDGEWYGLRTSMGVPIVVGTQGWQGVVPLQLWEDEARLVVELAARIESRIKECLRHG